MSVLSALNPFSLVLEAANTLIDRLVPDTNAAAKAKRELAERAQEIAAREMGDQRDINKAEADHPSVFVAGWRPAAGWMCVGGMGWQYFIAPLLTWIIQVGMLMAGKDPNIVPPLPLLGDTTMENMLYSLLGIGLTRTADKIAGVDAKAVGGMGAAGVAVKAVISKVAGR